MLSEVYSILIWVLGGYSAIIYVLEALGVYSQGLGFLDPITTFLALYASFRLGKNKNLSPLQKSAAVCPAVLFLRHAFSVLPENPFTAIISIIALVVTALALYMLLGKVPAKKNEPKAFPDELGLYPICLSEEGNHWITTKQVVEHVQVIGKSGSGKSVSYFHNAKYQAIKQGKGCFSFDAKSEELPMMAYYAQEAGRISDFIPFDLRYPDRSPKINPLAWFKDNGEGQMVPDVDLVTNIARQSVYFMNKTKDDFFENSGKEFIKNLTGLFLREFPVITYFDYYQVVANEIESFESVRALCDKYPETLEAQYFKQHWSAMSAQERRYVLSGLLNLLSSFVTGAWAPLLNSKTPNYLISEIVQTNKIFHFGAAALLFPVDYRKISCAFLIGLMGEAGRRSEKPQRIPFDFFLDEFSSIAYPGFEDIVEKVRSTDIGVHLGHQSLGDLLRAGGPAFQEAILDNTTTKIFFRIMSDETADRCAKIVGTQTAEAYRVRSVRTNAGILGGEQEAGATIKERDKEFIMPPDEFKNLKKGEAICLLTYKKGIARFKLQFDMAPAVPATFDFMDVVGLKNYNKDQPEKSLPYKRPVKIPKIEISEQGKPAFQKDPVFQNMEKLKKEIKNQRKPKPLEKEP